MLKCLGPKLLGAEMSRGRNSLMPKCLVIALDRYLFGKFLQSALRTSKISNGILPYCENSSEGGYYWRWWCALAICASVLRNANISTSRKPIIRTIFVEHTCQRILQRRSAFCLIMTNLKIKSKTWNYQRKEWFIKGNLKFTGTFC